MKSSRSVSCSAPLKGDAIAATLPPDAVLRGHQTSRNDGWFRHAAGKRPHAAHACVAPRPSAWRARAPCWRAPSRGGADRSPTRCLGLLGAGSGAAWTRVTSLSLTQRSPVGQVWPWGPRPGRSQKQQPGFTRFQTQPTTPEWCRAHKGNSLCCRVKTMKETETGSGPHNPELSAEPWVLGEGPRGSSRAPPHPLLFRRPASENSIFL